MAQNIVTYRSKRFTPTCRDAVKEWERLAQAAGISFTITQGGFNGTAVSASAGTHAGDALDLSVNGLNQTQVTHLITLGRMVGFAAWFRTTKVAKWGTRAHGFGGYHIHAVPNGWGSPSSGAKSQATSYRNGRDGLATNQQDLGPGHTSAYRTRTWVGYLTSTSTVPSNRPPATPPNSSTGGLTMSDINTILAELATIKANTATAFGPLGGRAYLDAHKVSTGHYVLNFPINRAGGTVRFIQELADTRSATIRLEAQLAGLTKAIQGLASDQGVDLAAVTEATRKAAADAVKDVKVDPEAVAAEVIRGIGPIIKQALVDAQGDVEREGAEEFAQVVLDELYARLEK